MTCAVFLWMDYRHAESIFERYDPTRNMHIAGQGRTAGGMAAIQRLGTSSLN